MRYAQSIAAEIAAPSRSRHPVTKRILAAVIDALHESRRRQAKLILQQYRHLIDKSEPSLLGALHAPAADQPQVGEQLPRKPSMHAWVAKGRLLVAVVLIAFLLLHILAGVILLHEGASSGAPRGEELGSQLYD